MLTVACVLRSGGGYTAEHVRALQEGVATHLLTPHRFICLSDIDVPGVDTYALRHGWSGWWSKLEIFRPGLLMGRVLYLDLDTVVIGDLSEIASYSGAFAMLSDFLRPERPASGAMAWNADSDKVRAVWHTFTEDPEGHIHHPRGGGDQAFLRSVVGDDVNRLQDFYPGQIVSYKAHCQDGVPDGARLVCAHGKPKPWDAEWHL
jgi:hypothetical protein